MTTSEEKIAQQCAAVLVNRFVASMSPVVTRLTFFEAFSATAVEPRTAVCMTTQDAIELHRLLGQLIATLPSEKKVH